VILDTQFLVAGSRDDPDALAKASEIDGSPNRIPTAVVWEIFASVGQGADPVSNQREYQQYFDRNPILNLTEDIARRAGVLLGRSRGSDTNPDLDGADSIVAAHGLALNEPIVSNDSDFQHVEGLKVETY
jgi:tRNA(fMet)-specific endonuclease VapC